MQKSTLDWGKPGTARHRRKCLLKGISQAEIGSRCKPKRITQTGINQFESGSVALTWEKARRLAPAYFPELWKQDQEAAVNSVWALWFATVEAGDDVRMKALVEELKANWSEYPWERPVTGLFAVNEAGPVEAVAKREACQS